MKNRILLSIAVCATVLLAFASCQKEESNDEALFTATIESSSQNKTAIQLSDDRGVMTWVNGDQVAIYSTTPTNGVHFKATVVEGNAKMATFRRVNSTDDVPDGDMYYAIYPASLSTSSSNNVISLGATQTFTAGRLEAPMYAQSDDHNLTFHNLCGVLHITLSEVSTRTVSSIVVTTPSDGVAISGNYTVNYNNGNPTMTLASNGGHSVTLSCNGASASNDFFIYLPADTYPANGLTITVNFVGGNTDYPYVKTLNQSFTIARNNYYTLNFPPEGTKGGLFTVGENSQVRFAQGNLQYQASTGTWRFAEKQFIFVGGTANGFRYGYEADGDNALIADDYSGWIDLFGWGTGNNPTMHEIDIQYDYESSHYASDNEWGNNVIANGGNQANLWRTLSSDEWNYLINIRPGALSKRSVARVQYNNKYYMGFVILPDEWQLPTGCRFSPNASGYNTNSYSEGEWAKMEAAGAVFLPAAGERYGTVFRMSSVRGLYWSCTPGNVAQGYRIANVLYAQSGPAINTCSRFMGNPVRLVRRTN